LEFGKTVHMPSLIIYVTRYLENFGNQHKKSLSLILQVLF